MPVATRLDQEQQRILQTLLSVGQSIKDPRTRRVYERAAVQTGLVESGLRNLNHGDADSLGWRQERASLYRNPTNVQASAERFRDEFLQHYDPGEKSYQVAAQVQRPREDLRGRYQDEARDAAAILAQYGGGGGAPSSGAPAAGSPGGGLLASVGATPSPSFGDAQSLAPLVQKLMSGGLQRQPVSGGLPAPSFATRPVMGGQTPVGGGGPGPRADIGALIDASRTAGAAGAVAPGPSVSVTGSLSASPSAPATPRPTSGLIPLGGSKNAGKGAFTISGPNPERLTKPLTSYMGKVAEVYGGQLQGLDGSTHSRLTVNGNVSEHSLGRATDVFRIGGLKYGDKGWERQLIRAGQAALIVAGMPRAEALKQRGGLYNVGDSQVIFNVTGDENGGNHLDHLHASRRPRRSRR